MKRILLPTDFSDNSWNAIKYALQLYKDQKCSFTLLNTFTPVIYQYEYLQSSASQLHVMDIVKQTSQKKLDALLLKIETEFNNPNHVFCKLSTFNTLTAEINELIEEHVADMIIMGTKGASGVKEILLGSNTIHVLKSAKCPVLVIPSNFTFETPLEILFPSDYNINFKDKHLQPILDIAEHYHSRVNTLHVFYGDNLSEKQVASKQKIDAYFKNIAHLFHDVKNQNITEAITKFQLKARINLLVMINNKHSFFENLFFKSTINQIGSHLNIPFLVIPSRI